MDRSGTVSWLLGSYCSATPKQREGKTEITVLLAGCSKRLSSAAEASEGAEAYPLGYVEGPSDARTNLAGVFSILLVRSCR